MSIKDRLAQKTADLIQPKPIQTPSQSAPMAPALPTASTAPSDSRVPRTGPGQMLAYRAHMQENRQRVDELEALLKQHEGSLPVRKLDPKSIRPSRWANRHESTYDSPAFAELKGDVETAGGNVQPILVRPLGGELDCFELVFGHRRHRACLELGLPVLSMVDEISDKELFALMDRENRARSDLSPYEQGEMYRKALDEGIYPSLRQMAGDIGVNPGNASKAMAIARLPAEVLAAFDSPTQIQYRWGQELLDALQRDPEGTVARAKKLRLGSKRLSAANVMDALLGRNSRAQDDVQEIKSKGRVACKLQRKADGAVSVTIKPGALDEAGYKRLTETLQGLILSK